MFANNIDEALELIKKENNRNEHIINRLREKLRKLRDEYDKDEEIQEMKSEVKRMRADLNRGFPISEKEEKRIEEWQKKHDEEVHGLNTLEMKIAAGGCIGGRYSYHFVPTSIFVSCCVKCESCGEEFNFYQE